MNHQNREFCYHHPHQILVGVCPFCLNERLLVVAAEKGRRSEIRPGLTRRREAGGKIRKSGENAGSTKIFAFRSLLNRLEPRRRHRRRRRSDELADLSSDYQSTSTSLEDSFISIKFEDNGVALWDNSKNKPSKASQPNKPFGANTKTSLAQFDPTCKNSTNCDTSVVEHVKTSRRLLRWRNRISHLLQLVKWKKSNKGSGKEATHVDGVGVVKTRSKGWKKTFTKRKSTKK